MPCQVAIQSNINWYTGTHIFTKVYSGGEVMYRLINKANLRDLIATTGLVILLTIGFKSSIFGLCNLEIWRMISKNNRACLLYYIKLWASFQSHRWIQTGVTIWKLSILVKISDLLSCVTLKFDGWPWKPIRHLFYTTSNLCIIS